MMICHYVICYLPHSPRVGNCKGDMQKKVALPKLIPKYPKQGPPAQNQKSIWRKQKKMKNAALFFFFLELKYW